MKRNGRKRPDKANKPNKRHDKASVNKEAVAEASPLKSQRKDLPKIDAKEEMQKAVAQRQLLIDAWHARQELYTELFGEYAHVSPANYRAPSAVIDASALGQSDPIGTSNPGNPNLADQYLAVLAYGPESRRPYWTYVTAGLCTPWSQQEPDEVSGFGCELIIKSPVDSQWPVQILKGMAYYIFNHAGTISPGVRIALHAPISIEQDSQLRNLVVWYTDEAPDCWYQLPSGGFGLFTAIGITDDELKFAESIEEYGTWCIQEVLRRTGYGQISNPERNSVMSHENIDKILLDVKAFSDKFRAAKFSET